MILDTKYKIGDPVFLITDTEQKKRIITGYYIRETSITYLVSCGTEESTHYDFEMTKDINILKRN
jgi:hypothetical protein